MNTTCLRFASPEAFATIAGDLYRRARGGATEAGCFVLGHIDGSERTAERVVYFDELDPEAYHGAAIRFDTAKIGPLYDICEREGLAITGDIHVHPCEAFLSYIDRKFPVVAVAGHVAVILPYAGRFTLTTQIAVNVLTSNGWREVTADSVATFLNIDETTLTRATISRTELLLLNSNIGKKQRRELLRSVSVGIAASDQTCRTIAGQAALLTAAALCTRFAQAGVFFKIPSDPRLCVKPTKSLSEALTLLGATPSRSQPKSWILVGDDVPEPQGCFSARVVALRGAYGCTPASIRGEFSDPYVPGAVLGTSVAVGEIFRALVLRKMEVEPRARLIRLWRNTTEVTSAIGYKGVKDLWLAGFGHIGNAYAWTLALDPTHRSSLYIQDDGQVELANVSTQLFLRPADIGCRKIDIASRELCKLGFDVATDSRTLDLEYNAADQPKIVLAGFDNVQARQALSRSQATTIIDAGLGNTATTFSTFSITTLRRPIDASEVFYDPGYNSSAECALEMQSYKELGADDPTLRCGLVAIADSAVAASFVGTTVAALGLTLLLRDRLGFSIPHLLKGDVLGDIPDLAALDSTAGKNA